MTKECACRDLVGSPPAARAFAGVGVLVWTLALVLLPKCPICGVAYLSLTGLVALPLMPGWERWWPLIFMALALNVGLCLRQFRASSNQAS
jgi:hypothetical protein